MNQYALVSSSIPIISSSAGTRIPGAALLQVGVLNLQGLETFKLFVPDCSGWNGKALVATRPADLKLADAPTILPPEGTATLHCQLLRPYEHANAPLPKHSDVVLRWEAVSRPGIGFRRLGVLGIPRQR